MELVFTNKLGKGTVKSMPIWIYFVIAGIIVSGIMAIKAARQEREVEDQWIEQEGQKYISRMNEEKRKKHLSKQDTA